MAPVDAHLTVVLDLATFAAGREEDTGPVLLACQRAVARVLALCLAAGQQAQWTYRLVDSRLPPHAFTQVAEYIKFSGEGRQPGACHDRSGPVSAASFGCFCRLLGYLADPEAEAALARRSPQGFGRALQARRRAEAAAHTNTPMANLRMYLAQLLPDGSAASAAAHAGGGALVLLSPAPTCAQDLTGFLKLGPAVDLAALDITAALAAEAAGGPAVRLRTSHLRVCWVNTGRATPLLPEGEDAVGWRVGLHSCPNPHPGEPGSERWDYGVVSEYDAAEACFRVKMDTGASRAGEELRPCSTDWVQPCAVELGKAARLAVAQGGVSMWRSSTTAEDIADSTAALARVMLGSPPPAPLQDASGACMAQMASVLPGAAGRGAAATPQLPPELHTAGGPEELAAVLRGLASEADAEPGPEARPAAKQPRRRAKTAEQELRGPGAGKAAKAPPRYRPAARGSLHAAAAGSAGGSARPSSRSGSRGESRAGSAAPRMAVPNALARAPSVGGRPPDGRSGRRAPPLGRLPSNPKPDTLRRPSAGAAAASDSSPPCARAVLEAATRAQDVYRQACREAVAEPTLPDVADAAARIVEPAAAQLARCNMGAVRGAMAALALRAPPGYAELATAAADQAPARTEDVACALAAALLEAPEALDARLPNTAEAAPGRRRDEALQLLVTLEIHRVLAHGELPARKRPLQGVKAFMSMLTISILGDHMSDRDFWRCVIEPRYGAALRRETRVLGKLTGNYEEPESPQPPRVGTLVGDPCAGITGECSPVPDAAGVARGAPQGGTRARARAGSRGPAGSRELGSREVGGTRSGTGATSGAVPAGSATGSLASAGTSGASRLGGEASSRARRHRRTFARPPYMSNALRVGRVKLALPGRQRSKLAKGGKPGDTRKQARGGAGKSRVSASEERTPVGPARTAQRTPQSRMRACGTPLESEPASGVKATPAAVAAPELLPGSGGRRLHPPRQLHFGPLPLASAPELEARLDTISEGSASLAAGDAAVPAALPVPARGAPVT
ncbi:hypothetical protein WJX81_005891 [Elliptochloris bilobata]|uniref:Uncharacterized protein n=1 Tax=Elliptochloris bilobata TaxID=381761 RepID=A0AAW1SE17_9CHLO